MSRRSHLIACLALMGTVCAGSLGQSMPTIVMASTTSTEQSGLFAHLLPAFKQATGD
jgi:tungstate transport system substrate-binding protein